MFSSHAKMLGMLRSYAYAKITFDYSNLLMYNFKLYDFENDWMSVKFSLILFQWVQMLKLDQSSPR